MSSNEDKNQKKGKRSFISKLPSFRRKKSPVPETPPPKSTSRVKKHRNENASNAKASITKETQTPKHTPKYRDKSTSRFNDDAERGLTTLKEEERNGNNAQPNPIKSISNLNTTSIFATTTATSFTNPVYEGDVWSLQNQKRKEQKGGRVASHEINANINGKQNLGSPTGAAPLSPVKTSSYQHIVRCSSVTSTLSSGSSLSLSSPGSLTKLIAGPKPYKSVFGDEQRGVKRQGSTPSDIEFGSSCVSVSGSVSSLSPTVEDVALKVTVRSGSVPGLNKYHPYIAPIESLSPGVSPKHKRDRSRREGAYTYDSSGCESEDSSKKRTLTRENVDTNVVEKRDGDISPTSIVNLNFDLQSAAAASPLLNVNVRRDRQKFLASSTQCAAEEPTHKVLTAQQESPCSAEPVKEEALISQAQAAPPSCGLTNNNPELVESTHEPSVPRTETHVGSDSRLSPPQPVQPQVKSSTPLSTPCNNAAATAGQGHDENSDQALLTRVRSVTSPIPIKTTPRTFFPRQHLQLSAMRNKLRSESFDSSDLDSLASDDLMCEAETFMDPSDESLLTHRSSSMPTEHGLSPCSNSAKGKRMRNNSIEFLVASFDKRHRHHSTGESPRSYSGSVRGMRVGGTGPGTGRDMVVLEASTYRHMVQELSSMKMALVKLSKMLQDPKALSEMLSAVNEGRDTETVTMDSVVQCELIQGQAPTETQVEVSSCEAAMQCEAVLKEDRGVQSDVAITGCIRCESRMKAERTQAAPATLPERPASSTDRYHSREACLSISSSSSAGGDGDEECLRGSWKGSSGLDQGALSPLGNNSHSSGDTSDDSIHQRSVKAQRKHVRISDEVSSSPQTSRPKLPSPRASSLSKTKRDKVSSSDEGSQESSSRLKQPTARFGFRVRNGSQRSGQDLSSSDDGSSSRVVCRRRNQSDSSNEGSEDSGPIVEKSRLPQMRRPVSKMQRPRQIQRPTQRPSQQKGRRQDSRGVPDGRGIPHASKPQNSLSSLKGDIRQHQEPVKPSPLQEQQANLEWQQLQLQQQQEKLYKQQVAARKQQQESQQRMQTQQQQLQRDQQERAAANLQQQQEMLMEQQQQQMQRQHQQQQQWQQQQQRSLEAAQPKVVSRPVGKIIKQSSNQDLTFTQRKSTEAAKAAQEHWHSSPDLIENQGPPNTHAATVHNVENQNRSESQKPKSRLVAPSAVSRLPSSKQMLAKREPSTPQSRNVSNGIPGPRSKLASPMSPRRSISVPASSNVSKVAKQSPLPERRIPEGTVAPRHGATQLHVNQNNNPLTSVPASNQQETTTYSTTVTTITTTVLPTTTTQTSKIPSPSRSIPKPVSRLAQPKVKVPSRIPKGPGGVSTKGRESN